MILRILRSGLVLGGLFALCVGTVFAQATITGSVTDSDTGQALPGANIIVQGTSLGAATNADGKYTVSGVAVGTYTVVASFIGYESAEKVITVRGNTTVNFVLLFGNESLEALEVFASRAVDRKTPVAYTNIDKVQIQRELGSRDAPLVLNTAPSVYATAQGGGAGDARVNVRGFNQRNVAIMINGVPVNDMENGWVYWSNWDGVGDATSSVQLQRGLSAVNLATPSIGGTMNIITDPAALAREVKLKQEVGNDGFFKTTATVASGLINGKYAFTLSGVRKTGDGYYDGTWTDAWAYYAAAAWNISSKHRLDFYAVGAPQRHGQNLYRQNLAAYDHEYAREVFQDDPDSEGSIADILGSFPEAGRRWNETASSADGVSSNPYDGWKNVDPPGERPMSGSSVNILNERENFFHKPQLNLNWYAQFSEKALLSTVLYYSGGKGGGTGTHGSMGWDYSGPSRAVDWASTVERNLANGTSRGILRNSHNVQWTIGGISKLKYTVNEALTMEVGLDWRTADIEHYYSVRDLLGGSSYERSDNEFAGAQQLQPGDKFNYFNTNTVDWAGTFAQGEYTKGRFSGYGMAGLSMVKYSYTDHFRDAGDGSEFFAESDNIIGYQVKGGGLYNLNDQFSAFGNIGYVSKTPIFDGAIDDVSGIVNPDPKNEKFLSVEAGVNFRSMTRPLSGKVNVYSTNWQDRTITRSVVLLDGDDGLISLLGLDALHRGIEGELAYQPLDILRFDGAISVGNWEYTDDVAARYSEDASDPNSVRQLNLSTDGLKVGDAPQTQFAYAVTLFPVDGLYIKATGRSYSDFWADFDPSGRSFTYDLTQAPDRGQSWKTPAYNVFDINLGYDIPAKYTKRVGVRVFANVFNVFDSFYIQDASDNSRFNAYRGNGLNHSADDAEVFLGLPRTFNFGTSINFR